MTIAIKYSFFAAFATLANLIAQETSSLAYAGAYAIYLAMAAGTLAGLISKYLLDKHYIFAFKTDSTKENIKTFFVYGVTGIATTILFCSFELGFEWLFGGKIARYLGAVIGLAIGYGVKYRLDKRYVFSQQEA
ncbi:MAG: GtrA family protein [Pseudohongiella sp.]|jgi:putative flippase GtrA|nr:GtrA family protein [Pseudohongiella sp.]